MFLAGAVARVSDDAGSGERAALVAASATVHCWCGRSQPVVRDAPILRQCHPSLSVHDIMAKQSTTLGIQKDLDSK